MVAPIPAKRGRKPAVATAPATGQVQSLTRGLKLLEWIAESNGSVALTELAQQAGLPNSTTHRLLTTMQQQGFVRQVGELGHWAIGAHAFMVGSSFLQSRNLLAIVHPILRNLMEESGETVNMAVLDQSDHEAIIIDQVQCTHLMRMSAPIGGKLPMHASGAGKAFSPTERRTGDEAAAPQRVTCLYPRNAGVSCAFKRRSRPNAQTGLFI